MSRSDRPLSSQGRVEIGRSWYRICGALRTAIMFHRVTLVASTIKNHLDFVAHGGAKAPLTGVPARAPTARAWCVPRSPPLKYGMKYGTARAGVSRRYLNVPHTMGSLAAGSSGAASKEPGPRTGGTAAARMRTLQPGTSSPLSAAPDAGRTRPGGPTSRRPIPA
jgi:hypothetical protein